MRRERPPKPPPMMAMFVGLGLGDMVFVEGQDR